MKKFGAPAPFVIGGGATDEEEGFGVGIGEAVTGGTDANGLLVAGLLSAPPRPKNGFGADEDADAGEGEAEGVFVAAGDDADDAGAVLGVVPPAPPPPSHPAAAGAAGVTVIPGVGVVVTGGCCFPFASSAFALIFLILSASKSCFSHFENILLSLGFPFTDPPTGLLFPLFPLVGELLAVLFVLSDSPPGVVVMPFVTATLPDDEMRLVVERPKEPVEDDVELASRPEDPWNGLS